MSGSFIRAALIFFYNRPLIHTFVQPWFVRASIVSSHSYPSFFSRCFILNMIVVSSSKKMLLTAILLFDSSVSFLPAAPSQ